MTKYRRNKQDDEIFLAILPKWNAILDEASNGRYRNTNTNDNIDGSLLTEALNLVCLEHKWTKEDFGEYQSTLGGDNFYWLYNSILLYIGARFGCF